MGGRASAPRCHDGPSVITPRRRRGGDDAAGTVGRAGTRRNEPAARTGTAGTPPGTVLGTGPGGGGNRDAGPPRRTAADPGVAEGGAWLTAGAPAVPAGAGSGACAVGALLNAAGPTGAGAIRGRPGPACWGGRGGLGGRGP